MRIVHPDQTDLTMGLAAHGTEAEKPDDRTEI
jgi:hypothetical protein